jgi:hypothetical protein
MKEPKKSIRIKCIKEMPFNLDFTGTWKKRFMVDKIYSIKKWGMKGPIQCWRMEGAIENELNMVRVGTATVSWRKEFFREYFIYV